MRSFYTPTKLLRRVSTPLRTIQSASPSNEEAMSSTFGQRNRRLPPNNGENRRQTNQSSIFVPPSTSACAVVSEDTCITCINLHHRVLKPCSTEFHHIILSYTSKILLRLSLASVISFQLLIILRKKHSFAFSYSLSYFLYFYFLTDCLIRQLNQNIFRDFINCTPSNTVCKVNSPNAGWILYYRQPR